MKTYKNYIALVKVNDKTDKLRISTKSIDDARNLAATIYEGWKRTHLINSFEIVSIYADKGGN